MQRLDTSSVRSAAAALFVAVSLAAMAVVACSFDGEKLTSRSCGPSRGCSQSGEICCRGFCVLAATCADLGVDIFVPKTEGSPDLDPTTDRDLDTIKDDVDNCPDTWNRDQADLDGDKLGDVCDCSPTDQAFTTAVINLPQFSAPVPFKAVESTDDWRLLGTFFQQGATDGMRRAAFSLLPHRRFLAQATFSFKQAGDDDLIDPVNNVSLAGVAVRTNTLADGKGDAYYCGVDLASWRVMIGRSQADELGQGKLHLFADPLSKPGKAINRELRVDVPYTVLFRVVEASLSCTVILPDLSRVEYQTTDAALTTGQLALFTVGASADFRSVKVCATQ
jgi:hypothetical protein